MVHTFAKEYGWSKSQINEVYPDEALVLMKLLAYDKQDDSLMKQIEYYQSNMDRLYIQHGEPKDVSIQISQALQSALALQQRVVSTPHTPQDDDLPDFVALARLKEFKQTHK